MSRSVTFRVPDDVLAVLDRRIARGERQSEALIAGLRHAWGLDADIAGGVSSTPMPAPREMEGQMSIPVPAPLVSGPKAPLLAQLQAEMDAVAPSGPSLPARPGPRPGGSHPDFVVDPYEGA